MQYKRYEKYKDSGVEWIGEVPKHWEIMKGRYFLNLFGGYAPELISGNEDGLNYFKVEDLNQISKGIALLTAEIKVELNGNFKPVKAPVVLIPKRGAAIYTNKVRISYKDCIFDSNIMGISVNKIYSIEYIAYALYARRLDDIADVSSVPQINNKHINKLSFPCPELDEQKEIVIFISKKTSEIDTLICDKEHMIELLQEKRQAIISEAVTKGLNPNVKMKDSGVEWIGEIPEHWDISKVKYYYDVCLGKMIQPNPNTRDDTLEKYLCSVNVQWEGINIDSIKEMWFAPNEKKKYALKSGDLVVCEGGDAGRAGMWYGEFKNCYIQNAVHRVRGKDGNLNKYLYYWLYFVKNIGYIDLICNRATIMHFTAEKLNSLLLIIPNTEEQQQIVAYLDQQTSQIDTLIQDIQTQIEKLKEYRQSLITEAVTGKIDVRDYAG